MIQYYPELQASKGNLEMYPPADKGKLLYLPSIIVLKMYKCMSSRISLVFLSLNEHRNVVIFKVWLLDQAAESVSSGNLLEMQIIAPPPAPLSHKFWKWSPGTYVYTSPPCDPEATIVWKPLLFFYLFYYVILITIHYSFNGLSVIHCWQPI